MSNNNLPRIAGDFDDVSSRQKEELEKQLKEIDVHIGKRLRRRRRLLGLSQSTLANAVGIRFQQIQKYECGQNRIGAPRLWLLAQALELPSVQYFYEGLGTPAPVPKIEPGLPPDQEKTAENLAYLQQNVAAISPSLRPVINAMADQIKSSPKQPSPAAP